MIILKILLSCYWLIPHLGGVWPFMQQLKNQLEKRGHTVDVFGNGTDIPRYHMLSQDRELLKDHILPVLQRKLNHPAFPDLAGNNWKFNAELDRYCMELSAAYFGVGSYDVIHTQDVISTLAMSRVKAKHTGLVASIHGSIAREVSLSYAISNLDQTGQNSVIRYYRSVEHHGAAASDITITSTEWMRNLLVHDSQIPADHIVSFPYGLDTENFYRIQAKGTDLERPFGKKVIICPARLTFIKGIRHLIDALAIVKQQRSDWVCWIVGDGDLRESLQTQAAQLGLGQDVLFLGKREDVPAMLTKADILAHPSIQDNQPFSIMEAQMAGLPCVVSDAGGLPEAVLHHVNGLVSPVGDAPTMASQLAYLLAHDDIRRQFGERAASWAKEHWSLDIMTDRMLVYYELARQKAAGGAAYA